MKNQWVKTVGGEAVNMHQILFLEPLAYEGVDGKFVGRVQAVAPGGKCFTLMMETFDTLKNAQEAVERFMVRKLEDMR